MYLSFRETFRRPAVELFTSFETPARWAELYGVAAPTRALEDGWYAVPLAKFPFPLVARNVALDAPRLVRWEFGGFWRGVGEVRFRAEGEQTVVEGFEYIVPHGLWLLASAVEERFMRREFERIWALGWRRLRKGE